MRSRVAPLLLSSVLLVLLLVPAARGQDGMPTTGFEDAGGSSWTTHEDELTFLAAVDAASDRMELDVIGQTHEGRPLHLVRLGHPVPQPVEVAREGLVELHVCSQHGNEPAGREACLIQLRDLALTDDPALVEHLSTTTVLFVPTANPDGRETNSRANAEEVDLNRNHLEVDEPETIAMGEVVRDWRPDVNMDHHEYGPSTPALYDDDLLYLWPRNLNVDADLRDAARSFAVDVLRPCVEEAGYTADEYGLQAAGDLDLQQTAGDGDDGISRNAAGLRHGMGILVESATSPDPTNPVEVQPAENMLRRVASQVSVIDCTIAWLADAGAGLDAITTASRTNAVAEGRERSEPTFFGGQDEDTTVTGGNAEPTAVQDPPFCGFRVTADLRDDELETTLDVLGVDRAADGDGLFVSMAQEAEPVIGLLLDERGLRNAVAAEGLDDCSAFAAGAPEPAASDDDAPAPTVTDDATPAPVPSPPTAAPGTTAAPASSTGTLPATGGGLAVLALVCAATAAMTSRGRRQE